MADATNNLAGRVALVTGGAVRIGREIALALARRGADVVVHYNRSEAAAGELVRTIEAMGRRAWAIGGDLLEPGVPETVFSAAVAQAGAVDILINNASIFPRETPAQVTVQSLAANMNLHALAPLILARAMARQCDTGHIVNLLDTRVATVDRLHVSYHISKCALLILTRMLALELAPAITVNAVAPGVVLRSAGQSEEAFERLAAANPMKRHGEPSDVADAVLYLVGSGFVTGQVIYVDGGAHLKGRIDD